MAMAQWEIFLKTHIKGLFRGKLGHELVPSAVEKFTTNTILTIAVKSKKKQNNYGEPHGRKN